ncbi:MAG: tetratricopeptide repeat protein [Bacteroidota bacterium]
MKKKILLLIVIFFSTNLFLRVSEALGQQSKIDSLLMLLKADKIACSSPCPADTSKVSHLIALATEFSNKNPDTGFVLVNEALQLSEKIKLPGKQVGWQNGIGGSYNVIGWLYKNKGDYSTGLKFYFKALDIWELMEKTASSNTDSQNNKSLISSSKPSTLYNIGNLYDALGEYPNAFNFYFKALKLDEESGDKIGSATVLSAIGSIYSKQGNYSKALDFYFRSEKMNEEVKSKKVEAKNLSSIGNIYYYQKNYTKALEYNFKALKVAEELGNKNLISTFMSNIGSVYYDQYDYTKALEYNFKSLKLAEELGKKEQISISLVNIGTVYNDQKDYTKALDYYLKALKLDEESGDQYLIASVSGNVGQLYTITKKNAEAEKYLLKALAISNNLGELDLQQDECNNLSALYEQTGNYKKSLEYYKKSMTAKDSLFNEDKAKEITAKSMTYEFEKKEAATKAENDKKEFLANAEIRRQKLIKNSTLSGVGIAGLFSFLLVMSFNRRRKTAFEKQVSQVEMTALRAQMNPHFIFNSLHSINKYVMDNDKNNASDYLTKFAKLMRLILENSREQEVPMEKDLSALELYMQLESLRFQNKFQYNIEVDPQLDKETALIPPLLLQPFVENSILHGLRTKENGKIQIKIKKEENMIRCSVEDNGIGRQQTVQVEPGKEKKRESLGMKITQERLNIINQLKKVKTAVNIFDLKDSENKPGGLRVELMLPFETAF